MPQLRQLPLRLKKIPAAFACLLFQLFNWCKRILIQLIQNVAVKKLSRPFASDIHAKRTYRELRLLKHFRHENVISMLNVFSSNQTFDTFSELYFVTHLMGSDLNNIIRTQRLTDDHVRFLTYQVSFEDSRKLKRDNDLIPFSS